MSSVHCAQQGSISNEQPLQPFHARSHNVGLETGMEMDENLRARRQPDETDGSIQRAIELRL